MIKTTSFVLSMLLAGLMLAGCGDSKKEGDKKPDGNAGANTTPAPAIDPTKVGWVTGKISFEGEMPKAKMNPTDADPYCKKNHPDGVPSESFVGKGGGLGNVYVMVKMPKGKYPDATGPAVLDQNGCHYSPHVVVVQTGQTLEIRNSDDTAHNVNGMAKINSAFNVSQPTKGLVEKKVFNNKEVIKIKCDIHGWMAAVICVSEHPYVAISAEDGTFKIEGLPPGEYEIEATHEKLGTKTVKVTVPEKAEAKANFSFKEE